MTAWIAETTVRLNSAFPRLIEYQQVHYRAVSVWSSSLPTLVGVSLGVLGSLGGQWLPTKLSRDAARASDRKAARDERKAAILEFLARVQPAEQLIEEGYSGLGLAQADRDKLRHGLWMAQKPLDLVASDALAGPTHKYAERLAAALDSGIPEGETPWTFIHPVRDDFLAAAKTELRGD